MRDVWVLGLLVAVVTIAGCKKQPPQAAARAESATVAAEAARSPAPVVPPAPTTPRYAEIDRVRFNRAAVRLNLPIYWAADKNGNGALDPDEIASLRFYSSSPSWVSRGAFTGLFDEAYRKIVLSADAVAFPPALVEPERARRALVVEDLDQGRATLVRSDLRGLSPAEKAFVRQMQLAARHIDRLFARQLGLGALAPRVPADDAASQSLFRRNWGPQCEGPKTEKNPACSAIPGAPKRVVDVWPAAMQQDPKFCAALEKHPDAKRLLKPFVVVRERGGNLETVGYHEAYAREMAPIAKDLRAAAAAVTDPKEAALKAYLLAAADSFTTNNWDPADLAWSKMDARNSRWYVRIGPDEVYWEPCSQKAGFHLTFARINTESLAWQEKLTPVQQEMENALAARIGKPYAPRKVTFHLPDFIDIIFNAGDDRRPFGGTIGQSLPNWGPLVAKGRGRTVAMSNLYTDADSLAAKRAQAESLFTKESMAFYTDETTPGLLSTILHEATHNLGPSHEYKVAGKKDTEIFGGPLSSTLEELKAQSGALWYIELVRKKGIVTGDLARKSYTDSIFWAFGHISRGMFEASGKPKPYSHLSAIQVGFLLDAGAITFDASAPAANGSDKGAFTLHHAKFPAAVDRMMTEVGGIKGRGDRARAEALVKRLVDGPIVPHKLITERMLRFPRATFVYAVEL